MATQAGKGFNGFCWAANVLGKLDHDMIFYINRRMRILAQNLTKHMVAFCVTLALVFLPVLSQQAMAAHHPSSAAADKALSATVGHSHETVATEPCDKNSLAKSQDGKLSCCDISCLSFVVFDPVKVMRGFSREGEQFRWQADEAASGLSFELKRPPRV